MKNFQLSTFNFQLFCVPLHAILCAKMKMLLVIALIAVAILLLCVGVIFRRDHTFRSQHIAENERMREHKIHCATSQDREAQRTRKNKINVKKL